MSTVQTSLRQQKRDLREKMLSMSFGYQDIAAEFARRYSLRPRTAWREAYGWSLQEAADKINEFRGLAGLDQRGLAGMTAPHLSEYENWPGLGPRRTGRRPTPHVLAVLAGIYGCAVTDLIDLADRERYPRSDLIVLDKTGCLPPDQGASVLSPGRPLGLRAVEGTAAPAFPTYADAALRGVPNFYLAEQLRQGLNDALSEGMMAEASLDDWEQVVDRYGRATRDRPAGLMADDLCADLAELKLALQRHRATSARRRLTSVTAQMCGLMCLAFCKIDDRHAFRRWAQIARLAAKEANDAETHSWVLAQEAFGHYYGGDFTDAIGAARQAQDIAGRSACVGAALAAALEARAQAATGQRRETREALARAESLTGRLSDSAQIPSAFGYNEAQLRFHAGSAYTHLQDVKQAFREQDRALELCMPGDYADWALIRLDKSKCLIYSGDVSDGLNYALETMQSLSAAQRLGIITARAQQTLGALGKEHQGMPVARDLNDLLMETTRQNEVPGSW
jgi:tetratricopeptide (TPR) repeat protein